MRCLVVADLHYSLPQFDWLLSAAPQFDLVVFAGDALDIASAVDFRAQILVVKTYLARLAGLTRVILCSGNHDLARLAPFYDPCECAQVEALHFYGRAVARNAGCLKDRKNAGSKRCFSVSRRRLR